MKTVMKILGGLAVVAVLVFSNGIGQLAGRFFGDSFGAGAREGKLDAQLRDAANLLNQRLPMQVDAETRLDSSVGADRRFIYKYTLVNVTADMLTPAELKAAMEETLINRVCTEQGMQVFVKQGVTVSYAYADKNGKEIAVLSVAPGQCAGVTRKG